MKKYCLLLAMSLSAVAFGQKLKDPTFEDILSLKSIGGDLLSPDGKNLIFIKSSADWENNRYDSEIWLSQDGATPFQLTNTLDGSSSNARWSADGTYVAFISSREGGRQIYIIRPTGGEAIKLTDEKNGINSFEFSPDGQTIAFSTTPESKTKKREDKFGAFSEEDNEYNLPTLWLMKFEPETLFINKLPAYTKDSLTRPARNRLR